MSGVMRFLAIILALSLCLTVPLLWVEANGFISASVVETAARAILLADGPAVFRATDAFYPPIPFTMALVIQATIGGGALIPSVMSAVTGAVLLYLLYGNFIEKAAYRPLEAMILVLLIAINPLFLRALSEGSDVLLLIIGVWIYGRGLVNLRLTGAAPDMMKVAVGLLIIPLSQGYGLLIAAGTLPFLVLAARPSIFVVSPVGYLVSMFFPVVAAIGSLLFVSAVLKTTFFSARIAAGTGDAGWISLAALAAPLLVLAVVLARLAPWPRYWMPLLALTAALVGAAALNQVYGIEPDPVLTAIPLIGAVAVALRLWPTSELRFWIAAALLLLSVPVAAWSIRAYGGHESQAWLDAASGRGTMDPLQADRAAALFIARLDGVIADAERHPGLVTTIGDISLLVVAGQPGYEFALAGGRPSSGYLAVRKDPEMLVTSDRLLRAFPDLEKNVPSGYELIYDIQGWRVFRIVAGRGQK